MKLGTQTGSLINHIMTNVKPATDQIEVGMGATICYWSDRAAATVIGWDGKVLTVQGDKATRTDTNGMSDAQQYSYERNPEGGVSHWRLNRKGQWVPCTRNERGRWVNGGGSGSLSLGSRSTFHDYSF